MIVKPLEELLLVLGSLIILLTFLYDYLKLLIIQGSLSIQQMTSYMPATYNWPLFIFGENVIFSGIYMFYRRYRK